MSAPGSFELAKNGIPALPPDRIIRGSPQSPKGSSPNTRDVRHISVELWLGELAFVMSNRREARSLEASWGNAWCNAELREEERRRWSVCDS